MCLIPLPLWEVAKLFRRLQHSYLEYLIHNIQQRLLDIEMAFENTTYNKARIKKNQFFYFLVANQGHQHTLECPHQVKY